MHFDTPFLTDIAHNADPSPQDTRPRPGDTPTAGRRHRRRRPGAADFAEQAAGTYDDELLDAHFAAGDGRVNENIALTTIHQIFHSEHDRLVDDIKTHARPTRRRARADLARLAAPTDADAGRRAVGYGYGERLFQAARFVTEMEYQHLVFEEFARKVQPAIRPFHVYHPDINPAIQAEFAHAVYRFGHSMLDDDVARKTDDAERERRPTTRCRCSTAFLNPPEYFDSGDDRARRTRRSRPPARSSWARRTRPATSSTSS